MRQRILIPLAMLACALLGGAVSVPVTDPSDDVPVEIMNRFTSRIYTLLTDGETGCLDCHSDDDGSDLVFSGNPREDLLMLIDGQYLTRDNPDSLLGRLTHAKQDLRMPLEMEAWSESQVAELTRFLDLLDNVASPNQPPVDEQFPRALMLPFHGDQPPSGINQFVSYRQLKTRIGMVFEDDGQRGSGNLFTDNIALFGGADFNTRFNESRQPSAAFLTGLELVAKDVARRAFQFRRGPFAEFAMPTTAPPDSAPPPPEYKQAIRLLYERLLFRPPAENELSESFQLLQEVYRADDAIRQRNFDLQFELTVNDPQTGLSESSLVKIPVNGDLLNVHQQLVDQSAEPQEGRRDAVCPVGGPVQLGPNSPAQRLVIHNLGTRRNVSFAGVRISNRDTDEVQTVTASSPELIVDGAWESEGKHGLTSLEDRNNHKGGSSITVPLTVNAAGTYQVELVWRANTGNANNVLIELFATGAGDQLVAAQQATPPEPGVAEFHYDCSNDTVAFFQPGPLFQFDDQGFVEISNRNTRQRVTAAAVEFLSRSDPAARFSIDSRQAAGNEQWDNYNEGTFRAYNVKGKKLHDNNQRKGELSLQYQPVTAKATDEEQNDSDSKPGWKPDEFYRVRIYYPGKVNNEPVVPVAIRATRSSPIIQIEHPLRAKADTRLRLDASRSYTVQGSELTYAWKQLAGTPVELDDPSRPEIEFVVPRPDIQEFAWSSLAAALVRHPDFLFTCPPSMFNPPTPESQHKLQLVRVAMDLLGRPPTNDEFKQLDTGSTIDQMIDRYLDSEDFRDYYFHQIRLMLESHGTPLDDEPARLWCYVAFNDRPFQEILTAEYTVDAEFRQQPRPEHHGKTGLLTTRGFIKGKPGLPHYNYAAQVSMLFLGYVYEVPESVVEQRESVTALGTTDPNSACYSCHKILTPLAFQRSNWSDDGVFRERDDDGNLVDATDRGSVPEYPFAGEGMEAFATQAARKERFIRTMINAHVNLYFGRPMRHRQDERVLYRRLWENVHANDFQIRELIRAILTSPEYRQSSGNVDQAEIK